MVIEEAREPRPFLIDKSTFASPLPARRGSLKLAAFTFVTVLIVYLFCLPKLITGGAAGELVTAAALGGVAHPPGYPLWTMLAGLSVHLVPFHSPAWRVALLSAVSAASAAACFLLWLRQFDVGRRASISLSLVLAFGAVTWREAVQPGVHSLTLLLTLAPLVLLNQWFATRQPWWISALALSLSLAVTHHPMLTWPALLVTILFFARRPPYFGDRKVWLTGGAALLVGFAPLLYLPARASQNPYLNWGDPQTWSRFLDHVTHGGLTPGWPHVSPAEVSDDENRGPVVGFTDSVRETVRELTSEHAFIGFLLGLCGLGLLWRRHRGDAAVIFLVGSTPPLLTIWARWGSPVETVAPWAALLLPTFAMGSASGALFLDALLQRYGNGPTFRARTVTALSAILPLTLLSLHFGRCDYSRYAYVEEEARAILDVLPHNAVLFTRGDEHTPALFYLQGVLSHRPDVILADPFGEVEAERVPGLPANSRIASAVAHLVRSDTRPVASTVAVPLPPPYGWRPQGFVVVAEQPRRVAPARQADPLGGLHLRCLPADPPHTARELPRPGAPLDASARRVAADYYEAMAHYYRTTGDTLREGAARRLVEELRKNGEKINDRREG